MKICIVKLSAMGDIIHAMVALEFIKKNIPNAMVDWVVEAGFRGILENNPNIDNILPLNLKSIKSDKSKIISQYKLVKEYAKNNYDIVIDAQGLIKSAIVSKLLGGNKTVGFDKESTREGLASLFYNETINIKYEANAIDRNMAVICKPLGIEYKKEDILNKHSFLFFPQDKNIDIDFKIVLVVGASRENKVYPKEKFLELVEILKEKTLVVWGNDEEHKVALYLSENSSYVSVAPKGNLDSLKMVISKATIVIGGDTGPTHIAWGLNIPSITIFGNTPEYRNTYITPINQVIKSDSKVNPLKLDYTDFSIKEIKPEDIANIYKIICSTKI